MFHDGIQSYLGKRNCPTRMGERWRQTLVRPDALDVKRVMRVRLGAFTVLNCAA